jgi:hypothetical protein
VSNEKIYSQICGAAICKQGTMYFLPHYKKALDQDINIYGVYFDINIRTNLNDNA